MNQSKAEAPRKRRVFSEEFKQDAIRLVTNEGYSFAADFARSLRAKLVSMQSGRA